MSAYGFDPEVCLRVLHRIAEEIPSGVSDGVVLRDVDTFVRNSITARVKPLLDWLWRNFQIPQKLKHLQDLEEKAPKSVAWRPTTGKVDMNPIKAKHLLNRKMELLKQIELTRSKCAKITPYLQRMSDQSKQQLEELSSLEQRISETC